MKLPLTIYGTYTSELTNSEILEYIENIGTRKKFKGIEVDKFYSEIAANSFILNGQSYGLDFITKTYPIIYCRIEKEKPTTLELKIVPNYSNIGFLLLFTVLFISFVIFMTEIEIGGLLKKPDLSERLLFAIPGIITGLYCYYNFIKPIKQIEKWIVETLKLEKCNK